MGFTDFGKAMEGKRESHDHQQSHSFIFIPFSRLHGPRSVQVIRIDTSCLLNAMKMVSFCCNVGSMLFLLSGSYGSYLWLCLPCAWPKKTHCQSLSQNPKCVPFLVCNSHDSPWLTRSAVDWLDMTWWRISVGHTACGQRRNAFWNANDAMPCWFDQRWQSQGHSSQLLTAATVLCFTNIWRFRTVSTHHNTS